MIKSSVQKLEKVLRLLQTGVSILLKRLIWKKIGSRAALLPETYFFRNCLRLRAAMIVNIILRGKIENKARTQVRDLFSIFPRGMIFTIHGSEEARTILSKWGELTKLRLLFGIYTQIIFKKYFKNFGPKIFQKKIGLLERPYFFHEIGLLERHYF